jgi:hypothetical protein
MAVKAYSQRPAVSTNPQVFRIMDEARRLAYLSAMGIDCYVLRESRPVVADLPDKPLPEPDKPLPEPDKPLPDQSAEPVAVGQQRSILASTLTTAPETQTQESTDAPQESRDATVQGNEADADAELRFSLQFYRVSEQLAVINEIPFLQAGRSENEVNNLLQAILRALGLELTELPPAVRFNWPLGSDDDASERRASEAYQALSGFMRKRLGSNFYDVVVVFGNQCEVLFDDSGVDELLEESSNRVIHTHSLDNILQVPALKQSVWESIRVITELLG